MNTCITVHLYNSIPVSLSLLYSRPVPEEGEEECLPFQYTCEHGETPWTPMNSNLNMQGIKVASSHALVKQSKNMSQISTLQFADVQVLVRDPLPEGLKKV